MTLPRRRDVLGAMALALGGVPLRGRAAIINGALPWMPDKTQPPPRVTESGWRYFTEGEAAAVEALVDRLIPPDPETLFLRPHSPR